MENQTHHEEKTSSNLSFKEYQRETPSNPLISESPTFREDHSHIQRKIDKSFNRTTSIHDHLNLLKKKKLGIRIQVRYQHKGFILKEVPLLLSELKSKVAEKIIKIRRSISKNPDDKNSTAEMEEEVGSLILSYKGQNEEDSLIRSDEDYLKIIEEARKKLEHKKEETSFSMLEIGNLNMSTSSYQSRYKNKIQKVQLIARTSIEFYDKVKNVRRKNNGGNKTVIYEGQNKRKKKKELNLSVQPVTRNRRKSQPDKTDDSSPFFTDFDKSPIFKKSSSSNENFSFQQIGNDDKNGVIKIARGFSQMKRVDIGLGNTQARKPIIMKKISVEKTELKEKDCCCQQKVLLHKYQKFLTKTLPKANVKLNKMISEKRMPCEHCYGLEDAFRDHQCRYCGGSGDQALDQKTEIIMSIFDQKIRNYILKPLELFFGDVFNSSEDQKEDTKEPESDHESLTFSKDTEVSEEEGKKISKFKSRRR